MIVLYGAIKCIQVMIGVYGCHKDCIIGMCDCRKDYIVGIYDCRKDCIIGMYACDRDCIIGLYYHSQLLHSIFYEYPCIYFILV